jgi:Flp pilus assembly protein TadG
MLFRISPLSRRSATVAPMAAMLMAFLTGMLAFSIDVGYVCYVQGELQDAADAAALAGVEQLQSPLVAYYIPGANQQSIYNTVTTDTSHSSSPIPTAQRYAYYNQAGGVKVRVPSSDISFSFYNGTTFSAPSYANGLFPNTVTVTTRRDSNANGPLSLFFGPIFGISTVSLTATASATMYNGVMTGMTSSPPYTTSGTGSSTTSSVTINSSALPVALDINVWGNYASGNFVFTNGSFVSSPSPYLTSSQVTANTTGPDNGLPQLVVYPNNTTNTPGNFGLIDLGPPATNTPAFRNWIDDGVTANDISYLDSNSLLPVSLSSPKNWTVGPGIKDTLVTNFQSVMGLPNLIPLFQPYSPYPAYQAAAAQGSTATYAVVGFSGVTITQADGSGNAGLTIAIQPSAIVSPTAIISNPLPAATITQQSSFSSWSSSQSASSLTSSFGPVFTTFVPAKLTQ